MNAIMSRHFTNRAGYLLTDSICGLSPWIFLHDSSLVRAGQDVQRSVSNEALYCVIVPGSVVTQASTSWHVCSAERDDVTTSAFSSASGRSSAANWLSSRVAGM